MMPYANEEKTAEERLQIVEGLLANTYEWYRVLKKERDQVPASWRQSSSFNEKTGKIRALAMVLDAFAEAGFDIRKGE